MTSGSRSQARSIAEIDGRLSVVHLDRQKWWPMLFGSSSRFIQPSRDESGVLGVRRREPPALGDLPASAGLAFRRSQVPRFLLGASFDGAAPLGGAGGRCAPRAGRSRERQAPEESDSVVVPRGQSRHDISTQHPPARATAVVFQCVESAPKLGLRRQPQPDPGRRTSRDESPPACAVPSGQASNRSGAGLGERRALDVQFGEAGNPRVRGCAAVLGGWQMPATQRPPSVAIRPPVRASGHGSLAPRVAIAESFGGERDHRHPPAT
jgi:hypothetical protein